MRHRGNYKDNEALQNYHEDLLHYDEYLEAQKIANDPTTKYIPTEEVMAHLEV